MKTLLRFLAILAFAFALPTAYQGCATSGSTQVVAAETLLSVGQAADAAVATSAKLYRDGIITAAQARKVLGYYNNVFQPAYRLASAAVQGDMTKYAPEDVTRMLGQLTGLVSALTTH